MKTAIVMIKTQTTVEEARTLLEKMMGTLEKQSSAASEKEREKWRQAD